MCVIDCFGLMFELTTLIFHSQSNNAPWGGGGGGLGASAPTGKSHAECEPNGLVKENLFPH